MMDLTRRKRARKSIELLSDLAVCETAPVEDVAVHLTREFLTPADLSEGDFTPCEVGFEWERDRRATAEDRRRADTDLASGAPLPAALSLGRNAWFRLRFTVPESMAGDPVFLRFVASPVATGDSPRLDAICFREGEPWQAFDQEHDSLRLLESADGGESFELLVEVSPVTAKWKEEFERLSLQTAALVAERPTVRELHRNFVVLNDLRRETPEDSPNRGRLLRALTDASHAFPFEAESEDELRAGAERSLGELDDAKENLGSDLQAFHLTALGHGHLDLAWHWPWSETVRKGARTFSNVLKLMDEGHQFRFLASQPHLYEFVRERYPSVFERVSERVESGEWEAEGALWVESDVNAPGGEALARQFLLGKRYFREEFDVDPRVAFVPDVFGYSPGFPAIARAADCPYFLTQKLRFSDRNEFPYKTFTWEGIGGESVLAHFPPADTYNGDMSVGEIEKSVRNHPENDVMDESVYLTGFGDGGGGVTREALETKSVVDEVNALPDVEFGSLEPFFERAAAVEDDLPTWVGELYLEDHRGTLTSQARAKRDNRKGEFALREAELWASLALATEEFDYPRDELERAWRVLLFNQFHDVLPGSGVTDVYADADRDYETVFEVASAVRESAFDALLDRADAARRVCVTNSLSWPRRPLVAVGADSLPPIDGECSAVGADGERHPVQRTADGDYLLDAGPVPALGAATVTVSEGTADDRAGATAAAAGATVTATERRLENERVRVTLDEGTVAVYDKEADREALDGPGNRLVLHRDLPDHKDAWDFTEDTFDVGERLPAPDEVAVREDGPLRAVVRQRWVVGDSTLVQDVALERDGKRVDFDTWVDWRESDTFLRAEFPADVEATEATYEVQFGHDERPTHDNTSWDEARYEEAHQKWVDVAERDYGVAVLNDCKYGVHVDHADVSLSLLRAPGYPDPEADRGEHRFQYSLLPHEGDLREGGVVEAGYEVNAPVHAIPVAEGGDVAPIELDGEGVVVEAVKRAEDDPETLVVRLYEAYGRRTSATLSSDLPLAEAAVVNLVEDREAGLEIEGGGVVLDFDPFEIRSVALTVDRD